MRHITNPSRQTILQTLHFIKPHPQLRPFTHTTRKMVRIEDIRPSEGADPQTLLQDTNALVEESGKWTLCNGGKGLERPFKFKTFKATWEFMTSIATECKSQKHHPEWSNVYNKTHIRWTTHAPEGLSGKDTYMARFCDEKAREFKEVEVAEGEGKVGRDGIVEAGGCCVPKKANV
ncbi:hypothetical protein M409DRAFT_22518 [Zasmidium cellare ATCC 36951]|uniref:4a-hydroxytetrahydrobiopterin dehydratase n=1 Tax=Zasmidium cellare ATCC 36951 TaxID=1080233 RepID=A0A6A6CIP0_ZASCE|nr:uncharacterized protein M409DRAFT_22518 [Zasmidium cellare ATCC 36951]KAF2167084.1 hypothetical protein M409DRAFT_22518 [Zasmidium cellare ATCC 36951]